MSDWSSDVCSSDLSPTASSTRSAAYRAWSTTSAASRLRRSSGSEHASAAPTSSTPTDPDRFLRLTRVTPHDGRRKIGRASCTDRVCQYVQISRVWLSLHTQTQIFLEQ